MIRLWAVLFPRSEGANPLGVARGGCGTTWAPKVRDVEAHSHQDRLISKPSQIEHGTGYTHNPPKLPGKIKMSAKIIVNSVCNGGWVRGMPQTHLPFPRTLLQIPWTFTTNPVDIYYKSRGHLLQIPWTKTFKSPVNSERNRFTTNPVDIYYKSRGLLLQIPWTFTTKKASV